MKFDWRFGVLLICAWIVQATIIPYLTIGFAEPDLILIVIATYAFLEGPTAGALAGFSGGLLQDMLLIRSIGLNILTKTLVGYLSGMVERTLFGSKSLLPMVAMFAVSVASQFFYISVSFIVGEQIEIWLALKSIILPSAAYTSIITLFIFPWLTSVLSHERKETVFK